MLEEAAFYPGVLFFHQRWYDNVDFFKNVFLVLEVLTVQCGWREFGSRLVKRTLEFTVIYYMRGEVCNYLTGIVQLGHLSEERIEIII